MNDTDAIAGYLNGLCVGDKVKFRGEKRKYTIKAKSDRYLICTKPFNVQHTCLYTIIDLKRLVRGPNNLVFNVYDYTVQEDIDRCLAGLESEDEVVEVSYRKCVPLDVDMEAK